MNFHLCVISGSVKMEKKPFASTPYFVKFIGKNEMRSGIPLYFAAKFVGGVGEFLVHVSWIDHPKIGENHIVKLPSEPYFE